ncbi:MAG: penicillin acylase family protein [Deltaproteobacteria bacterium]|nr:penicillin acylase family protein [Deltaproteobacteria bacterium]
MKRSSWRWLAWACAASMGCSADDPVVRPRLEIIIDDLGVPHVFAATDADAFYGAGYQMASDRLFHMEMTRRRALGRQAEVLGQAAVEDDELARIFDWPGWAAKHTELMRTDNPETYAVLEAWTRGVNARIDEIEAGEAPRPHGLGPDLYDFVPEPWTPHDVMSIATMTGFGNDLSFDREVFATIAYELAPQAMAAIELLRPIRNVFTTGGVAGIARPTSPSRARTVTTPAIDDPLELARRLERSMQGLARLRRLRGLGSNNWVVAGEHTANGRPMLCGDPHLGFDPPGVFYAQHINSKEQGGTIDAAGFSFVGTPGISVGHTERIAWAPTTAFADVMDVWTVALPDDDHVAIGGQVVPVVHREEVIVVRGPGKPVGEGSSRSLALVDVPGYGVLLPTDLVPLPLGEPGDRLLMNWTGFQANAFKGLLDFNVAESIDEFDRAVDRWNGNFNFVAVDAGGITYRVGTKVPVRDLSGGRTPHLVQDGDDAGSLWTAARLPPAQLPHGRGEARGFIATANNDPFGFAADGRIDNDPWYFGAYFDPGWRADRIESQLQAMTDSGGVTLEQLTTLQRDAHSGLADDLLPLLFEAHGRIDSDAALAEFAARDELETLVALLSGWDRQARRDSAAALVMHAYTYFVARRTLEDDMPLLFLQALELQPSFIMKLAAMALRGDYPSGDAVLQEGRDVILLSALADVAALLQARYGTVEPAAYRLADARFADLDGATGTGIDRGRWATDGAESSINVAADSTFFDASGEVLDEWRTPHGPIFRIAVEFEHGDTPRLHFSTPLGNVAEPDSPHWQDMMPAWLDGPPHTMLFERAEIEAASERRYTLLDDE